MEPPRACPCQTRKSTGIRTSGLREPRSPAHLPNHRHGDGGPMRSTRYVVLSVASLVAGVAGGHAQAPAAGNYSAAQFTVKESRGLLVAMRDGVHLSVDIYQPDAPGRHPGILSITPYDNTGPREQARWFAKRGYVVVLADSRGRYDS